MGERRRRNKQLAKNGANSNKGNREEDLHGVLAQQMEAKRQREQVRPYSFPSMISLAHFYFNSNNLRWRFKFFSKFKNCQKY